MNFLENCVENRKSDRQIFQSWCVVWSCVVLFYTRVDTGGENKTGEDESSIFVIARSKYDRYGYTFVMNSDKNLDRIKKLSFMFIRFKNQVNWSKFDGFDSFIGR